MDSITILFEQILFSIKALSPIELIASLLGLVYVWGVATNKTYGWIPGIISSSLFIWIFYDVNLYAQSFLQIAYVALGIYGWLKWKKEENEQNIKISNWNALTQIPYFGLTLLGTCLAYFYLKSTTDPFPFLDALGLIAGLVATYLTANRVLESWFWWICLDIISVYLFYQQELYLTAVLYFIYCNLSIHGYREWTKEQQKTVEIS
jgi:nicotinamide mononucleotide transporter